jgi:hypothetical protein
MKTGSAEVESDKKSALYHSMQKYKEAGATNVDILDNSPDPANV